MLFLKMITAKTGNRKGTNNTYGFLVACFSH